MPCTYDDIEKEYTNFDTNRNGIYFLIDSTDIMVAKEFLYNYVSSFYNKNKLLTLMPQSWILQTSKKQFIDEYDPNKIYIIKKNVQRQNGLNIFNNKDDILKEIEESSKNTYPNVIIQELLQDPYLIDGRKINLRVYVLVTKQKDISHVYVYNDGFMYYTSEKFKQNSIDPKVNITTGYIDRSVYEKNPLTHKDFREYLIKTHDKYTSELVFNNINNLLKDVFIVFLSHIGNGKKLYNNLKFQLFGVDVAIDNTYGAKIMEINKGPDLGAKDTRDSELKHNLVRNIFNTVGLCKLNIENQFIEII